MTTRVRFAVWCAVASAIAVLLSALVALVSLDQVTTQVVDARLASAMTRVLGASTVEAACTRAREEAANEDRTVSVLVDDEERCRSRASGVSPRALDVAGDSGTVQRRVGGQTWRTRTESSGRFDGIVVVSDRVDASLRARDDARTGMYVAIVFGLVLATVIGALAARPATRRIDRLVQRVRQSAAHVGDESAHVGRIGSRDLDAAAAAVDQLLDDLRASDAARRRLFADAAHELRTPVTSIRTNAQLLTRDTALDTEARDIAERIARQSAVVGQLVAGLVDHAGALGWGARLQPGVRLGDVVEDAARAQREHDPDAIIELELDDSVATADAELVRRAVGNLLDNARRHGAGTTHVTLAAGVIAVADDGSGFDEQVAADAFRPFARGADTGSGLGLAFVDHVARAHGGAARIASLRPAVVELHLPIEAPGDSQEAPRIPSGDARASDRSVDHAQGSEEVHDERAD